MEVAMRNAARKSFIFDGSNAKCNIIYGHEPKPKATRDIKEKIFYGVLWCMSRIDKARVSAYIPKRYSLAIIIEIKEQSYIPYLPIALR